MDFIPPLCYIAYESVRLAKKRKQRVVDGHGLSYPELVLATNTGKAPFLETSSASSPGKPL
jgi:hypothetical protein